MAKENNRSTFYAGRTRKEGSVVLQTHLPPALTNPVLLDGSSAADPWIRFTQGVLPPVITPTRMAADMTDHPTSCARKVWRNETTKSENLLFHSITEYELWTTLCARSPGGDFQQFAHFHWILRWDQKFNWHGNKIVKGPSASFIKHDAVAVGLPADSAVQALLKAPADPVANKGFNEAARNFPHTSPNYTESSDRFYNLPPDFFTP